MSSKTYNKTNFHKHTFCIFTEVAFSEIENLKLNFTSKSGSSYYFTELGVYRLSNHWSRVANCRWRIVVENNNDKKLKLGFALWTDFHQDNDYEKLYFIELDENCKVNYFHKNSANFKEEFVLRTASETTKIIKQIRNLLETNAWAKHINKDITVLRKEIIDKLITTNQSFQEIRRSYL